MNKIRQQLKSAMLVKQIFSMICMVAVCSFPRLVMAEDAEQLFSAYKPALYQIRLIEKASDSKSSIGSGFQINQDGVIATNYHVISGFVQHPNKYHLEYLDQQGNKAPLIVLDVDVINDLAIVKRAANDEPSFMLALAEPSQGEKIFSLGNPHDLGMIVVPGTYNGLKKRSFYDRIHFTGSVNPGMSGGPTVNEKGEVIGINVATAGNQIGFLVPLDKLKTLYDDYLEKGTAVEDLKKRIGEQLIANQQEFMQQVLSAQWQVKKLGSANVPGEITEFIRCWGDSNADKREAKYLSASSSCAMGEQIYLSSNFRSGDVRMQYKWLKTEELNRYQFYNMYRHALSGLRADNRATKNDVTEFSCSQELINVVVTRSKAVICSRAYKEYPGLFDVAFIAASYDKDYQGLVSEFNLSGVDKTLALQFAEKFMESATWN